MKNGLISGCYVAGIFLVVGCTSGPSAIRVPLDVVSPSPRPVQTIEQQRISLQEAITHHEDDAALVQDVDAMLRGMHYDSLGQTEDAVKAWYAALPHAEGSFGEKAVHGWIKAYCRNLGKKTDRMVLVKLLLAETQMGNLSPWIVQKGYSNEQKFAGLLSQLVPEFLEGDPALDGEDLAEPAKPGIPAGDPLLTATAAEVCRYKQRYRNGWKDWRRSISSDVGLYFDALVLQCSGGAAKAADMFVDAGSRLSQSASTAALGVESYARAIKIKRDAGERETVAPYFLSLMRAWKQPSLTESSFGMTRQSYELRRIDDALSAARHRALVNDTENTKLFVQEALNDISSAHTQSWSVSPEIKTQLAGITAEGYYLLAFRLAVEARDWQRAVSLTTLALQTPGLNEEWRQRLQWSLGLYDYMAANYDGARRTWEQMLSDNTDDTYRPMLLFWISQCHAKVGNSSESNFYRRTLTEDHPLSYYSVVGLRQTGSSFNEAWQQLFKDHAALESSLRDWTEEDLSGLRADAVKGKLLRRAELLTAGKVDAFSLMALDALQTSLDLQSSAERDQRAAVYVSRLYGAAGHWLGAIAMTTKLSKQRQFWEKFPEQMLVFFPRLWGDAYQRAATDTGIDQDLLLGLTRQESGFKSDAKSPANAYGLMQLTPPTARKVIAQTGIDVGPIPDSLLRPEANIRLGAANLKGLSDRYKGFKTQMYAAYNAGEQTVDSWVDRRSFEDPLLFIEFIPYSETRSYVKNVWRNEGVYAYLRGAAAP